MKGVLTKNPKGRKTFLWDNPELRKAFKKAKEKEKKQAEIDKAWKKHR